MIFSFSVAAIALTLSSAAVAPITEDLLVPPPTAVITTDRHTTIINLSAG